ncbi:porin family protein [Ectothiorhodospiraceae bacterium 2226]|nr:porin family protein [Ectothiorhodospiraceae bacterium 2226]
MKKKILAAALVAAGATFSLHAGAQETYFGAQLGIADVSGFSDGTALILTLGQDRSDVTPGFSIEGEFTTTLSDPDVTFRNGPWTDTFSVSYWSIGGYGAFRHALNEQLSLRARAGLLYHKYEVEWTESFEGDVVSTMSGSDSDIELSFGFGVLYAVNPNLSIVGEYTRISSDVNHLSAGVQYRF